MIAANYFDGRNARLHPVQLEFGAAGLAVAGDGIARLYPVADVRLAEPFENAPNVLRFADGASCEVSGRAAGQALAQALGWRKPRVVRWQEKWPAALAALVLLAALLFAAVQWGVPALAERIADRLPPSVDKALGETALDALNANGMLLPSRFSDERLDEIGGVLRAIAPAHPRMPLRLLVRSSPQLGQNALALPDGTIVLTDEMVRFILGKDHEFSTEAKAQLAGILAHEIGHLELRHSTRAMARTSLTAAGSAALFGDFSMVAAGVPAMLLNMSYSRAMETQADDYAVALLHRHGIATVPLADLFDQLERDGRGDPRRGMPRWMATGMDYGSSHPAGAERSARIRGLGRLLCEGANRPCTAAGAP